MIQTRPIKGNATGSVTYSDQCNPNDNSRDNRRRSTPRHTLMTAAVLAFISLSVSAAPGEATGWTGELPAEGFRYDPSAHSREVTECDRMASHPDDPNRVAPGMARSKIDLPNAIKACQAAVTNDPQNPRLNYLLGRTLGYSGRGAEGLANRQVAVKAGYPQSLFVVGYMSLYGINQQPKDVCLGAEMIRRSAFEDRLAGQLGFVQYVVTGLFDNCPVRKDKAEMLGFIAAARKEIGGDYYQGLLADLLEHELKQSQ